jgi:hypothetical protein
MRGARCLDRGLGRHVADPDRAAQPVRPLVAVPVRVLRVAQVLLVVVVRFVLPRRCGVVSWADETDYVPGLPCRCECSDLSAVGDIAGATPAAPANPRIAGWCRDAPAHASRHMDGGLCASSLLA